MKTIEQAAVEKYAENKKLPQKYQINDSSYIDWFKAGAEFAQQWISIQSELPTIGENVLLLFKDESLHVTKWSEIFNPKRDKITHWRPITNK